MSENIKNPGENVKVIRETVPHTRENTDFWLSLVVEAVAELGIGEHCDLRVSLPLPHPETITEANYGNGVTVAAEYEEEALTPEYIRIRRET